MAIFQVLGQISENLKMSTAPHFNLTRLGKMAFNLYKNIMVTVLILYDGIAETNIVYIDKILIYTCTISMNYSSIFAESS